MEWEERVVELRFAMGDVTLFAAKFKMLRLQAHFTELSGEPDSLVEVKSLPRSIDGALLLSHPVEQALPRIARTQGLIRYAPQQYEHYFTDLSGDYESYVAKLQKKSLQELQRKTRRFREHCGGKLDIREYRRHEQMEEYYRLARQVSATTYQEKLLHVGMPDNEQFFQKLKTRCDGNETRAFVMMCGELPVAYSLGWRKPSGVLQGAYLGYDPAYAKFSPGSILYLHAMEQFMREGGYTIYDHGLGESSYKKFFSTGSVLCADLYYLRNNLRNSTIVRLHSGADSFFGKLGRSLDAVGLKSRIKKFLRPGH